MEDTEMTATENTQTTWTDVANASADAAIRDAEDASPPRHLTQPLLCKLTDDEVRGLGDTLEEALANVDTLAEEKKSSAAGFKARIELAKERVDEIRGALRSKKELRDVECIETYIYRLGVARMTRLDTGEIVEDRALTASERQPSLPGVRSDEGDTEDEDAVTPADDDDLPDFGAESDAEGNVIADPQAVLDGEPQAVATKKRTARAKKKAAK